MRRTSMVFGLMALLCGAVLAEGGLIRSVSMDTRGPLPLGQSLNVRVDGAAGGQGRLAMGGRFTPMLEVAPGVYRARYTVGVDDRQGAQPVAVYLFMPDGRFETRDLGLVSLAPQRTYAAAPMYGGESAAWAPPAWTAGAPRSFAVAGYSAPAQPVMVPSTLGYDATYSGYGPYGYPGYGTAYSPYGSAAYSPYGYSPYGSAVYSPYGYNPYAFSSPGYTSLNLTGNGVTFQQVQPTTPTFMLSPFGTVVAVQRPDTLALSINNGLALSGYQDGLAFSLGQGGLSLALLPQVDAFFLSGAVAPSPFVIVHQAPLLPVAMLTSDPLTYATFAPAFGDFVTLSSARQIVLSNWPDRNFVTAAPIRTHVPRGNAWGYWRNRTGAPMPMLVRLTDDRFDPRRFGVAGTYAAAPAVRVGPRADGAMLLGPRGLSVEKPRKERIVIAPERPQTTFVVPRRERVQVVAPRPERVQVVAPPRRERGQVYVPKPRERQPEIRWQAPRQERRSDIRWQAPKQERRSDIRWQAQAPRQERVRIEAPRVQVQQPVRIEAPRSDNRGGSPGGGWNGGGHGNGNGGGGGQGHGGGGHRRR